MAYGCNIGPHIMAQMITGISYQKIKDMFDWQLTEDAHRIALADMVNGIGSIEITKAWGEGKTAGLMDNDLVIAERRYSEPLAINLTTLPLSFTYLWLIIMLLFTTW